jgi:photosystem II stability/assembly factor-like uncharacterized protein
MLLAGSDDGVYRVETGTESVTPATKILDAERVYRVRTFDGVDGAFAASDSGLYHTADGEEWARLGVPESAVYAVTADPSGTTLYAGTRPARIYRADLTDGLPTGPEDWTELAGFAELRERADWGLPRHDGKAQVRSLQTHPDAPERLVAGLEVGGVFLSEDGGETWDERHATDVDSEHPDDVHELVLGDRETFVIATGDGLLYSDDAGQHWRRLDSGHSQRYFRGALVRDGVVYAAGAHGPSPTWNENTDHAIFESRDGETGETVPSPTPDELVIGWCVADGDVYATTHRGSVLRRTGDGYTVVGSVPTPGQLRGRYLHVIAVEF